MEFRAEPLTRSKTHVLIVGNPRKMPHRDAARGFNEAYGKLTQVHCISYLSDGWQGRIFDILIILSEPQDAQEDRWLRMLLDRKPKDALVIGL